MRNVEQESQNQFQTNAATGGAYGNLAGQDRGMLMQQNRNAINNPTGYNANQQHEMLTAGEAGTGGATGSIAGAAGLAANRTRNSGALTGTLDNIARTRAQGAAKTSEGIAANSAQLGQKNKEDALHSLLSLYGSDSANQLKAGQLANQNLDTSIKANQTGWLQNAEGAGDTAANIITAIKKSGPPTTP